MDIDLKTLTFVLGITHIMQIVVFYHQYRVNKTHIGIGWWLLWSLAEAIGFGAIIIRNIIGHDKAIINIQNTFIIAGTIFLYIGIRKFLGKTINLIILIPLLIFFLIGFNYYLYINENIELRSVILNLTIGLISIITAYSLYTYKYKSITTTANFNSIIFLIHGVFFIYRSFEILNGAEVNNFFSNSFFNLLPFIDALIVSLLWTFGLIIMLNQSLQSEITKSKEKLQLIFNTSPDASLITSLNEGLIIDANNGFTSLTGYTKEEIINKTIYEINFWKNISDREQLVKHLLSNGSIENYETKFLLKNGDFFYGLISSKTIEINEKKHIISLIKDISIRIKEEEIIQQKNIQLEALNNEKDKFFSIIAHDLKNPFNSIMGFSELLIEQIKENDLEGIDKYAEIIQQSSHNAMDLLTNLLEWSRSQTGHMEFNPEYLELNGLINNVIALLENQAMQKSININKTTPKILTLKADKDMLSTILRNLISNAIKFTNTNGEIHINAEQKNNQTIIKIKDNGIGINKNTLNKLFRIEENISSKGTNNEKGTGLGLVLCKEFIEKHDGKIWAESEEGKGSSFYFSIPQ